MHDRAADPRYHASILSESLFLSLLVVFLGLSIRFAHYPTWRLMVLVAITVGASAVVRRTGFAFVPVMLVMVLLQRQRLRRFTGLRCYSSPRWCRSARSWAASKSSRRSSTPARRPA